MAAKQYYTLGLRMREDGSTWLEYHSGTSLVEVSSGQSKNSAVNVSNNGADGAHVADFVTSILAEVFMYDMELVRPSADWCHSIYAI